MANDKLESITKDYWELSKTEKTYLKQGKVLAISNVFSKQKKTQSFGLKSMAMHKKSCRKVLRKLSLLEYYSEWISFIKKSTYKESAKLFTLLAKHPLLPFPMLVHIIVDRPKKVGIYPFTFPTGIFKGLKGQFEIIDYQGGCLFMAKSYWQGKHTGINDLVIEIFSETLSKLGGDVLMRKVN